MSNPTERKRAENFNTDIKRSRELLTILIRLTNLGWKKRPKISDLDNFQRNAWTRMSYYVLINWQDCSLAGFVGVFWLLSRLTIEPQNLIWISVRFLRSMEIKNAKSSPRRKVNTWANPKLVENLFDLSTNSWILKSTFIRVALLFQAEIKFTRSVKKRGIHQLNGVVWTHPLE